jgi:hypothetical protein
MKRTLIVFILLLAPFPVYASVIQLNSEAAFLDILKTPYLFEDFNSYTYKSYVKPTLTLEGNGYSAVLSSERNLFSLNGSMSAQWDSDSLIIDFSSSATPITAVGGFFFPDDKIGNDLIGYTKITLFDGTEHVVELESASHSTFLGFGTAGTPFQYLKIEVLGELSNPHSWVTVDSLYVGADPPNNVIPTPEPSYLLLLASCILGIYITARKRMG